MKKWLTDSLIPALVAWAAFMGIFVLAMIAIEAIMLPLQVSL